MATNPTMQPNDCEVCATVSKCLDLVLDASLALAVTLRKHVDPTEPAEETARIERLHIMSAVLDWTFAQALKDVNPEQLMKVIANNLKEHGIIALMNHHGPVGPASERFH